MPTPSFQFYPKDWLADLTVQAMTAEERGVYITLLAIDWNEDGLPDDNEQLAALCKCKVETVSTVVQKAFTETVKDTVLNAVKKTNKRLQRERLLQAERRQQCSAAGKVSAQRRAEQGVLSFGVNDGNDRSTGAEQALNSSSASASANKEGKRSRKPFQKPALLEVAQAFESKGLGKQTAGLQAQCFINHYESNGWLVGSKKMVSWRHAVANWYLRMGSYNGRNRENTETRSKGTFEADATVFEQLDNPSSK